MFCRRHMHSSECSHYVYKLYWLCMRYPVVHLAVCPSVCKQFLLSHLLRGYLSQRLTSLWSQGYVEPLEKGHMEFPFLFWNAFYINPFKRCEQVDCWRDTVEKTNIFALYILWSGFKWLEWLKVTFNLEYFLVLSGFCLNVYINYHL